MSNTDKLRTWNVTLTTLSPLFIGSGKTLSPYSDFIQEGNNLIYLNQKKIEEAISNKPELIDEYVKEIRRKMDNTKSDASLKDFITDPIKTSIRRCNAPQSPFARKYRQTATSAVYFNCWQTVYSWKHS
jgi:CRISPR type III-A-associated RAMP protein Csm5